MHLFTHVHFRHVTKMAVYTIRSTVHKNPMLQANITARCLIERELLPIEVLAYIAGIVIFDLFGSCDLDLDLDPMTVIYELDS